LTFVFSSTTADRGLSDCGPSSLIKISLSDSLSPYLQFWHCLFFCLHIPC
jgi:hypothetical protein